MEKNRNYLGDFVVDLFLLRSDMAPSDSKAAITDTKIAFERVKRSNPSPKWACNIVKSYYSCVSFCWDLAANGPQSATRFVVYSAHRAYCSALSLFKQNFNFQREIKSDFSLAYVYFSRQCVQVQSCDIVGFYSLYRVGSRFHFSSFRS